MSMFSNIKIVSANFKNNAKNYNIVGENLSNINRHNTIITNQTFTITPSEHQIAC